MEAVPASIRRRGSLTLALVGALTLLVGWFAKVHFAHAADEHPGSVPGYTDIDKLYVMRHLAWHVFPYVHARLPPLRARFTAHGFIEYPVLTGLFIWLMARISTSGASYFACSAALLCACGVATSWLLARMAGWRTLIWALAPALVMFGLLNWDLLAVLAVVGAVASWHRGRPRMAAALLAVGTACKLYPVLLLLPLVLDALHAGRRRLAVQCAAIVVAITVALNLPFAVINLQGWLAPYSFQSRRPIDSSAASVWWLVPDLRLDPSTLNAVSVAALLVTSVVVLAACRRRARLTGAYPFVQAGAALVCAFLVCNKVDSVQYALWLLPFLVLVRIPARIWLTLAAADVVLYFGFFCAGSWTNPYFGSDYIAIGIAIRLVTLMQLLVMLPHASIAIRPWPDRIREPLDLVTSDRPIAAPAALLEPPPVFAAEPSL